VGRERLLRVGRCKEQRAASQKRVAILTRIGRHAMLAGKEISSFIVSYVRRMSGGCQADGDSCRRCWPFLSLLQTFLYPAGKSGLKKPLDLFHIC